MEFKYWGRNGFKGACRGKETWGGASDEALCVSTSRAVSVPNLAG